MLKRAYPIAVAALAGPIVPFGPPSAAQGPTSQPWAVCELHEVLPGGDQLAYLSVAGPGPSLKPRVVWSSDLAGRINLSLTYARGPASAPTSGEASYHIGSEPQPIGYKVVLDFDGAAPQATLPLGPGHRKTVTGNFDGGHNADLMEGFARARHVEAVVYEGDQRIAQTRFELAPERREAGLAAFSRRVQANEPGVCRGTSGPPLPVRPVPFAGSR